MNDNQALQIDKTERAFRDAYRTDNAFRQPEEALEHYAEQPEETDVLLAEYQEESERHRRLTEARNSPQVTSLAKMQVRNYPDKSFLIGPKLLPTGGRLLLTAQSGTGKSYIALLMAAYFASGKGLFGAINHSKKIWTEYEKPIWPINQKNYVLYLDYELDEAARYKERITPLINLFGQDIVENISFVSAAVKYKLHNLRGENNGVGSFDQLVALTNDVKPDVLIVDPLSSSHTINENSNELKVALNGLDTIISNTGCTVVLIHHESTKRERNDKGEIVEKTAIEQPRGHSCLIDWADAHLSLSRQETDNNSMIIRMDWGKARWCRLPFPRIITIDPETLQHIIKSV